MDKLSQIIDRKILQSAKTGDLAAFEKILSAYERPIFGYIFRIVGRKEDAEDLTQETFIKLYRHIGSLDFEKNFKAWVYKIATNTVYDWLKKWRNNAELFIIDDADIGFETIDPELAYYNIETACDLETAIAKIKPVYKTVLLLFYWQDLGYQEIAEIMSIPLNTVKTYIYRAKQALKKELNDE